MTKTVTPMMVLEALSKALGNDAPLNYARVFVSVAMSGEEDQGALARRLGISPSAMVRATQAMGSSSWVKDKQGDRKTGLDLIDNQRDPVNFKLRRIVLTPRGRKLAQDLGIIRSA